MYHDNRREHGCEHDIDPTDRDLATGTEDALLNDTLDTQADHSQLFIVRVWSTGVVGGTAWQGRVQHVLRGEAYSFVGWSQLVTCLEEMLLAPHLEEQAESGTPE